MLMPVVLAPNSKYFLRTILTATTFLVVLAVTQFRAQVYAEELVYTSANFRLALYGGYFLVGALLLATIFAWTPAWQGLLRALESVQRIINKLGTLASFVIVLLAALYLYAIYGDYGVFLASPGPRLALFWLLVVGTAALLGAWRRSGWLANLPLALLGLGVLHSASVFFNEVNNYPFSISWSEISRYYQASFFFSEKVYGVKLPLPITHPSRYLLQSVPFLFGDLPIWTHRLWQALLWMVMPALTAGILVRRLRITDQLWRWLFAAWVFLYLMQGAVFYHLLPAAFLVLWGFDARRPGRSFLFVALASIWAGISRVNWAPLPGALAALLYLLEQVPEKTAKPLAMRYWWQPALYFVGGSLVALAAYAGYIFLSGNEDITQFGSSFSSALLWARLLPNAAFPLGILPGILLVSAPLFVLIGLRVREQPAPFQALRGLAAAAILLVFFAGGLVVSVKIGGGTNLHNMDAYMVLLMVLAAFLSFGRFSPPEGLAQPAPLKLAWPLLSALLLIPVLFAMLDGGPLNLPDRQVADEALRQIDALVEEAVAKGGRVLFISQRHLLTFDMLDAPLIHDYEKLFLMEMAISHNDPYLLRFHKEIDRQQFALIITDPLFNNIKKRDEDSLAAENNDWVRQVSRPILCAYETVAIFDEISIQVLEPNFGDKCDQDDD